MRGKVYVWQLGIGSHRITPAYAGKSGKKACVMMMSTGSPPPMRGKAQATTTKRNGVRITPAYAGKSSRGESDGGNIGDHPRLCGEKITPSGKVFGIKGSPPPMRGKGFWYAATRTASRITPAYAGKSSFTFPPKIFNKDHPRLCGEKPKPVSSLESRTGSPPPMRGKVSTVHIYLVRLRITPAYAGKSLHVVGLFVNVQDHPRLCGEKPDHRQT